MSFTPGVDPADRVCCFFVSSSSVMTVSSCSLRSISFFIWRISRVSLERSSISRRSFASISSSFFWRASRAAWRAFTAPSLLVAVACCTFVVVSKPTYSDSRSLRRVDDSLTFVRRRSISAFPASIADSLSEIICSRAMSSFSLASTCLRSSTDRFSLWVALS